ncbi:hypothetical protein LSTR_LSTR000950 [Laodelphax striatellus]|uniref:FLYWCH-type domain-containing protein n=1 Tax=Laodelphax striatellus TaxID=195883 RepID=A0A482X0T4_LAOST|nr:hypothetical protein LSTR_LSTR000950 [Laodelphax striatellus]
MQSTRTIAVPPVDPLNTAGPDAIPLCDRNRPLYCKSNQGNLKMMLKGFGYNFRSDRGEITVWWCDKRAKHRCSVLAETDGDRIIKEPIHNHPPDWEKFEWEYNFAQKNKKA